MNSGLDLGISADCRRKVPYDLLELSLIIGRTDVDLVFVSANRSLSFFVDSTSVPFLAFCSWHLHMIDPIFIVLGQLVYIFSTTKCSWLADANFPDRDWPIRIAMQILWGSFSPAQLVMVFLLLVRPQCLLQFLSCHCGFIWSRLFLRIDNVAQSGPFILFVLSLWLSRRRSLFVPPQCGIVFLLESWLESAPVCHMDSLTFELLS